MATFAEEVEAILKGLDAEVLEVTALTAGAVIQDLVDRSPVLTGAYRASHAILGGSGNTVIFEGPERPGGDEIIKPGSRAILQPPDGESATAAVREESQPYERLEAWNGRFYASLIEYGSPSMAPRSIYGTAEVSGDAAAQAICDQRAKERIG